MKIKLDENLPADLTTMLLDAAHDVCDVVAEGLAGEDDPPVLEAATAEGRLLMTFDTDFANIRRYPLGSHAGIVVFRLRDQRWKSLEVHVRKLLESGDLKRLARCLAVVDESRVRIRRIKLKGD